MTTPNTNQKKKSISPKLILGLLFLCILLFIAKDVYNVIYLTAPNGLGLSNEMIQYKSATYGYSMLASSKWTILDAPSGSHKNTDIDTTMGSAFGSLVIHIFSKPFESESIDDVVTWGEADMSKSYREIKISEVLNEKRTGILVEYVKDTPSPFVSRIWSSKSMHCLDYDFLEMGYGYRFSFCSVEKVWSNAQELFMRMIDSIEIYG